MPSRAGESRSDCAARSPSARPPPSPGASPRSRPRPSAPPPSSAGSSARSGEGSSAGSGDDPIYVLGGNVAEWVVAEGGSGKALGGRMVTPYWLAAEADRIQKMKPYLPESDREEAQAVADKTASRTSCIQHVT